MATEVCSNCGAQISFAKKDCPACFAYVGAPNVRFCSRPEQQEALKARYASVYLAAESRGASSCLKDFLDHVLQNSDVYITVPSWFARDLASDPDRVFANYEQLVSGSARLPAEEQNDKRRRIVGAVLFGSYADQVHYGALGLDGSGLPTYGQVVCKIKRLAISERTTFIEQNSYRFHEKFGDTPPAGFQSTWANRGLLAATKVGGKLAPGQSPREWRDLLVYSDARDRTKDEFIEAHIFGSINIQSVESLTAVGATLTRFEKAEIKMALESFSKWKN